MILVKYSFDVRLLRWFVSVGCVGVFVGGGGGLGNWGWCVLGGFCLWVFGWGVVFDVGWRCRLFGLLRVELLFVCVGFLLCLVLFWGLVVVGG